MRVMTNWNDIDARIAQLKEVVAQRKLKDRGKLRTNIFRFKPFSVKQKKVLSWWCDDSPVKDRDGIIADGAIRSGKTLCMSLSFVMWAMYRFNENNFAVCGKTIGSLRRNVIFWLKLMLRSRGYGVKEHRADNLLVIRRADKVNYFYLFGGKDERSQDLIQGITLAGVLFDEVALMPESFVNQATARCSVEGSTFWFNCNPEGPNHWFYLRWIKEYKTKNLLYLHFTMDDNLSLSEKIKARYRAMYIGLWYQRFILGLWVIAAGIIYDMFDAEKHVKVDTEPFDYYIAAIDYGTANPCTFGLYGVRSAQRKYHLKREYYHSGRDGQQKTDSQYAADFKDFIGDQKIKSVIVDPSAASFIVQLRGDGWKVIPARNDVLDGIRCVSSAFAEDRFTTDPSCIYSIDERRKYVWDEKASQRGVDQPVKQNDHTCDRDRYALYTDQRNRVGTFNKRKLGVM